MSMEFELTPRPGDVYFTAEPKFICALKVLTGVFSVLSLLGALTIIVFQACCSHLWPNKGKLQYTLMGKANFNVTIV